jgi:hypothetical protein
VVKSVAVFDFVSGLADDLFPALPRGTAASPKLVAAE